jgi:CRISPR-associated protein Cmr6
LAEGVQCSNMMLCVARMFSEKVLQQIERGRIEFKGLKAELLRDMLNPHAIPVGSVCSSIDRVGGIYYELLLDGLDRLGYCVVDVTARTRSKLLIGASGGLLSTIFEVGLAWDYILDLPYIPASSIKGLMRSWLLHRVLGESSDREKGARRECVERVLALTGIGREPFSRGERTWALERLGMEVDPRATEASAGLVFVADAYPVGRGSGRTGCGLLDFDVVTPHYYRGGEPVRDEFEAQPVPVPHLVVAEGVPFRFVAAVDLMDSELLRGLAECIGLRGNVEPCNVLSYILLSALSEGVGARTGKGYGLFDVEHAVVRSPSRARLQRRKPGKLGWRKPPRT